MPELNKILRVCGPVDLLAKPYDFYSLDEIAEIKDQFESAKNENYYALILKKAPRRFQLSGGKIESLNFEPQRLALEVNFSSVFHPTIMLVNFMDDIRNTTGITEEDINRIRRGPYPGNMECPSTISIGPWKEGVTLVRMFTVKDLFMGAVIED